MKRSRRTIERWKHHGMPTSYDDRGRVVVEERVLLAYFRARLRAWPIHQQRMRVEARREQETMNTNHTNRSEGGI